MKVSRWFIFASLLAALLAPAIAPHDPYALSGAPFERPNHHHWLGTDHLGRDVLSRLLFGARRTLSVSGLATIIATSAGLALGLLAALPNAWLSRSILAVVDAMLAIPAILWSLMVITLLGSNIEAIIIAIGSAQIAPTVRVVYARALSILVQDYTLAARALGAGPGGLILRHVLPNVLFITIAYAAIVFSYSLVNSAALTFLGLAGEPGVADWGVLLSEGRNALRQAPWLAVSAGCTITLLVIALHDVAEEWTARLGSR